jgi:hypothetical protein
MLIAANVPEGYSADEPGRHSLEIEGPPSSVIDLHMVAARTHEQDRTVCNKDLVFINARTDEYLIGFAGVFKGCARSNVRMRVTPIDH